MDQYNTAINDKKGTKKCQTEEKHLRRLQIDYIFKKITFILP